MRLTAILLAMYMLLGSLFPGSDFCQMQRIAHLIDHFQEHKELALQNGQSFFFLDFVRIHFWETNDHSDNHPLSEHSKLPLQHIGSHIEMTIAVNPIIIGVPNIVPPEASFRYLDQQGMLYLPMILEPPIA